MVAPTFAAISALDSGTTTANRTPAVPSGVANGSFVGIAVMAASATNGTIATDFASIVAATQANASAQAEWKRATGADAGTYSVPHTAAGGQNSSALAFRVEGEKASGNPIGLTNSNSATGVTTIPTTSLGAGVQVDSLLVHVVWSFNARTYTPPAGFTRQTANASQRLHLSTMVSPGGATGNVNGSMGTAGMTGALLFEILPESAQTVNVSGFDLAVQFGTPSLTQSVVTAGFDLLVEFGTPTLVPDQLITPAGFDLAVEFGTPTVIGDQQLAVSGFDLAVSFGTPALLQGVSADGFDLPVLFGTPTLVPDQVVTPNGFDLPLEFGTTTVTPVSTLLVDGFDLAVVFGDPTLILDNVLPVTGFDLNVTFGTVTLTGQPFVTATVYDHETGLPVGAGAVVQLFDADGTLLDETTTDASGVYLFHLPMGFTDDVFTVVRVTIGGTDYQGVSDICVVQS